MHDQASGAFTCLCSLPDNAFACREDLQRHCLKEHCGPDKIVQVDSIPQVEGKLFILLYSSETTTHIHVALPSDDEPEGTMDTSPDFCNNDTATSSFIPNSSPAPSPALPAPSNVKVPAVKCNGMYSLHVLLYYKLMSVI